MNGAARQLEYELVKVCKQAWIKVPLPVNNLQAFEMRKDCAQEVIDTDGWCSMEGKGRGGLRGRA